MINGGWSFKMSSKKNAYIKDLGNKNYSDNYDTIFRKEKDMDREVKYDKDLACDCCGEKGAYDFMGDCICNECVIPLDDIRKEIENGEIQGVESDQAIKR